MVQHIEAISAAGTPPPEVPRQETDKEFRDFLELIDMRHVEGILTPSTPWAYFSLEVNDVAEVGIKGDGGLGVLAGDTANIYSECHIPLELVTLFYPIEIHQGLSDLRQVELAYEITPESRGYTKLDMTVGVSTSTDPDVPIDVYEKRLGSTTVHALYHPGLREVYADTPSADHRLYQEIVEGFGGYRVIKQLGLKPPITQLNEAPTVFAAIAELDDLCQTGNLDVPTALAQVRSRMLFTNHTLVQAVEGEFTRGQFEHFVFPNIKNEAVRTWLTEQFSGENIGLSALAMELAGRKNGVSVLHARLSSERFLDRSGQLAHFEPVTNGINIRKWGAPGVTTAYELAGALDARFHTVPADYADRIRAMDTDQQYAIHRTERRLLREFLRHRHDHNHQPIDIPEEALIIDWTRRYASYKRPGLPFTDPERLAQILEQRNAHIVIAGKTHATDGGMKDHMRDVLFKHINDNPILKQRVHYVIDYDEAAGAAIASGSDISINTPIVGKEACGTSWMKKIYNRVVLISNNDGGVADIEPPPVLTITGDTEADEAASLYAHLETAIDIVNDKARWGAVTNEQLIPYFPVIVGAQMARRYLGYAFPKPASAGTAA